MNLNVYMFICVACLVVAAYSLGQKKYGLMNIAIIVAFFSVLGMIIKVFG